MTRFALPTLVALLLVVQPSAANRSEATRGLGICTVPTWTADGDQTDCRFGTVAPAGDVNGDHYDDVLIGAYNHSGSAANEGKVYLYLGGPAGLSPSPSWTAESGQAGAQLGDKLSGAGDVNGDGYDDLVVGAGHYSHDFSDEGAAFLYLGSATGPAAHPQWSAYGGQAGAEFGACVQAAGDVNGDGYADVIVGSWLYDTNGHVDGGRAFVYLGSDTGLAETPAWVGQSDSPGAVYGYFCSGAGDLNGDGYDDIVVGARRFSGNGLSKEGRVYVYYGSSTGPSLTPGWIQDGGQAGGEFGGSVAGAGDADADGCDDLIVGAFRYDNAAGKDAGRAYLFLGAPNGPSHAPAWVVDGDQPGGNYGYHVDRAGDVDGDGHADVIVTAALYPANGLIGAGRAYVYLGTPFGLSPAPAWVQDGDQAGGELGDAARGLGDVNGDGYRDVGTGALYRAEGSLVHAGRAYVFYGCSNGRTDVPREEHAGLRLEAAGPNPFTRTTRLAFSLPANAAVRLTIHDLSGRAVVTLVRARKEPGRHVVPWNGRSEGGRPVAPGIYLARLETDRGVRGLKLIRLP